MTNQDRYDELDNFISTLRMLKDTLNSKDLIEEIEYLLYNTDYQNEMNRLEEIWQAFQKYKSVTETGSLSEGDFIAGIVFSSGITSTQVVCNNEVKWSGDEVIDGVFTPDPETVYNLVFWYDGININAVSRGA